MYKPRFHSPTRPQSQPSSKQLCSSLQYNNKLRKSSTTHFQQTKQSKLVNMVTSETLEQEEQKLKSIRPILSNQNTIRKVVPLNDFESMVFEDFKTKNVNSRIKKFKSDFCGRLKD